MKQVSADCQILSRFGFKWPGVTHLDAILRDLACLGQAQVLTVETTEPAALRS